MTSAVSTVAASEPSSSLPETVAALPTTTELGFEGITIAAVGDWYADDPEAGRFVEDATATRDSIMTAEPDLLLGLGDFTYDTSAPDPFLEFIAPLEESIPIYPTFGNHDGIRAGEMRRPNFYRSLIEHFGTDEWYSLDVGPVRLVSINSEYPEGSARFAEQFDAVAADLRDAFADPDARPACGRGSATHAGLE